MTGEQLDLYSLREFSFKQQLINLSVTEVVDVLFLGTLHFELRAMQLYTTLCPSIRWLLGWLVGWSPYYFFGVFKHF